MARIYKRTDRVVVKIDDVIVKLAPLSIQQKVEIQQAMMDGRLKVDIKEMTRGIELAMKYSIKAIEGVVDSDGNPYQLKFENDCLTSDCLNDLMNLEFTEKLSLVCAAMTSNIPTKFQGKQFEGVEVVSPESEKSEKNL